MKKIILVLLISTNLFAQTDDCKCDYIKDYYQLVYQAEINYLQNDFDKAYELLKQAEQNCELLNQPTIYEILILAELSLKKEKDVLYYIELALTKGIHISNFEGRPEYEGITKLEGWKALKEKSEKIYNEWFSNLNIELRHEIYKIMEEDQRVRQPGSNTFERKEVDDANEVRFKEILSEYGYPNEQLIGNYNIDEMHINISTFAAFHVKDIDYFKTIYLEYVRCGKAPADLYASLIDSHDRRNGIFTYGIYSNLTPEQIEDFENLDERRINAGLRPYEMEKRYQKLKQEKIQKLIEMSKQ